MRKDIALSAMFLLVLPTVLVGILWLNAEVDAAMHYRSLVETAHILKMANYRIDQLQRDTRDLPKFELIAFAAAQRDPQFIEIVSYVQQISTQYGLNPHLVLAIIHRESNFNPYAMSYLPNNPDPIAYGLMQIHYIVWKNELNLDVDKMFDLYYNINNGCRILRYYIDMAGGDIGIALHYYWAGPGATVDLKKYPSIVLKSRFMQ